MQAAEHLLQREEMTVSGCRSVKVFSRREDCCFSEGLLYSKKGKAPRRYSGALEGEKNVASKSATV